MALLVVLWAGGASALERVDRAQSSAVRGSEEVCITVTLDKCECSVNEAGFCPGVSADELGKVVCPACGVGAPGPDCDHLTLKRASLVAYRTGQKYVRIVGEDGAVTYRWEACGNDEDCPTCKTEEWVLIIVPEGEDPPEGEGDGPPGFETTHRSTLPRYYEAEACECGDV